MTELCIFFFCFFLLGGLLLVRMYGPLLFGNRAPRRERDRRSGRFQERLTQEYVDQLFATENTAEE